MHRVIGVGIYTGKETVDVLGSWTHNTSQGWQARTTSTSILPNYVYYLSLQIGSNTDFFSVLIISIVHILRFYLLHLFYNEHKTCCVLLAIITTTTKTIATKSFIV